jgi:hypothetical protein
VRSQSAKQLNLRLKPAWCNAAAFRWLPHVPMNPYAQHA